MNDLGYQSPNQKSEKDKSILMFDSEYHAISGDSFYI